MKHLLRILCCLPLITALAFATAQTPDRLVIEGREEPLHANPLEPFFKRHPERRPKSEWISSALWRGYIADFTIEGGMLYVRDIRIESTEDDRQDRRIWISVIEKVFSEKEERRLTWFTGFLVLPRGNMTAYVHMGYASAYERYRLILIRDGQVVADGDFSAAELEEYKALQLAAFARSEQFRKTWIEIERGEGFGVTINADTLLTIFDARFPVELLVDYKNFRPSRGVGADSAPAQVGVGKAR
jgi:hypothetical protein